MKSKFTLILLIGFTLFSCKKNVKEQAPKQQPKDTLKKIATETKPKEAINQKSIDYTFDMFSALGYTIGDFPEENRYPKQLMLKQGVDKYSDEGETWQVPKTIVSDEDEVLIDLVHGQEHRMGNYVLFAIEIVIHSKKLKNAEGIGVGSTIDAFERTYPFSKIYYTYVSEKVWLENGIPGYRFYIDKPKDFDKKVTINSDLMELSKDIFDKNTPITSIQITGIKGGTDFIGKWKGKDVNGSDIKVQIYEDNNKLYADVVAGVEVYHERVEELIKKDGKYFSLPISRNQVRIGLKQVKPKQLSFYMDENTEFEPMKVVLHPADDTIKSKPENISSECRVLDFTEEGGRTFVKVQLIDLVENNENGFDIVEKEKQTFELVKKQFKSCLEQSMSIDEIKTIWKQKKTDDHWYYINVENGAVTEFYLQNCAG